MKKLIFLISLLLCLVLTVSCTVDLSSLTGARNEGEEENENNENENEQEKDPENMIYNKTSELYLVCTDFGLYESEVNELVSVLMGYRDIPRTIPDTWEKMPHEIVIGETSRDISRTALDRLNRMDPNGEGDERYVIYSDGSSIAIVFDGEIAKAKAFELLYEKYIISDVFSAAPKALEQGIINSIEYYEEKDKITHDSEWAQVESVFSHLDNSDEIMRSLKALYSVYSRDMIRWLANLYEPNICICTQLNGEETCQKTKYCGSGAFYYSNSGRDTVGFMPDVESTTQAITILSSAGLGGYSALTPEMRTKIGRFVLALQEPNGFFYHPQWGVEFTDGKLSRRGRDLNWATGILNNLGIKPIYDTPNGIKGSGVLLTASPLNESYSTAISRVVATASTAEVPSHLVDKEAFLEYLAGMNLLTSSYSIGNTISAQISQIIARDKELLAEGADYSLVDILVEWLNSNMIEEVGHWNGVIDSATGQVVPVTNYFAVNGIMKISSIYSAVKREFPHADKAAMAAAEAITSDEPVKHIVDIYNNWYALTYLFNNIKEFSSDPSSVDEIRDSLFANGTAVIDATREKVTVFLKNDGSFSYAEKTSASSSQGCPVAVPNSNEGDVNATNLANSTKVYMANALGFASPKPLGLAERYIFTTIVNDLKSPIKTDPSKIEIEPGELTDFDEYTEGYKPDNSDYIDYQEGGIGGSVRISSDEREYREGNVLKVQSFKGAGETVTLYTSNSSPYAEKYVFEGEFCVESMDGGYAYQFVMGSIFMLSFQVSGRNVNIWNMSSKTAANSVDIDLGVSVTKGEWFKLKVECFKGTHDTFRAVIYLDTDLTDDAPEKAVAVTDNYFDASGKKKVNGTGTPGTAFSATTMYIMASKNAVVYYDNLIAYVDRGTYQPLDDPDLKYNVDANPPVEEELP